MESLAARCRPFVADEDPVHYSKVTKALGYFVRDDQEMREALKSLRKNWASLRQDATGPMGYTMRVGRSPETLGEHSTDLALAYRWLYGDLVHADNLQDHEHDITARYEAGALLTARIALQVLMLLDCTKEGARRGLIDIPGEAFTSPVLARTHRRHEALLVMAPVGTGREAMEAVADEMLATHHWSSPPPESPSGTT